MNNEIEASIDVGRYSVSLMRYQRDDCFLWITRLLLVSDKD
jgi:hypothetical protein